MKIDYELLPCWFSTATSLFCNYSHFVRKEVIFTTRILVSSILVQYSQEIPALNDIVLELLLDGSHFGLCPPWLTQVQFHMPQYLKMFIVYIVMYICTNFGAFITK